MSERVKFTGLKPEQSTWIITTRELERGGRVWRKGAQVTIRAGEELEADAIENLEQYLERGLCEYANEELEAAIEAEQATEGEGAGEAPAIPSADTPEE